MSIRQSYENVAPSANALAPTLVTSTQKGELVISSVTLATGLDVKHKSLLETIRTHQCSIEQFGHLPFETATVKNSVGAENKTVFCLLNENQALFIGSLSRNTPEVVKFKAALIQAFDHARRLLTEKERIMVITKPVTPDCSKQIVKLQRQIDRLSTIHEEYIKPRIVKQQEAESDWAEKRAKIFNRLEVYIKNNFAKSYSGVIVEIKEHLHEVYNQETHMWRQNPGEHWIDAAHRLGHGEKIYNVVMIGFKA